MRVVWSLRVMVILCEMLFSSCFKQAYVLNVQHGTVRGIMDSCGHWYLLVRSESEVRICSNL